LGKKLARAVLFRLFACVWANSINLRQKWTPWRPLAQPARLNLDLNVSNIIFKNRSSEKSSRLPELDGLRGLAILSVVAWHYWAINLRPAPGALVHFAGSVFGLTWSGVDLFFVLSGFLIGGILLDQREAGNYFKVFYTRRACRIVPLYYCVLILFLLSFLLGPAFRAKVPLLYDKSIPLWCYFTFTQNFAMAANGNFGPGWLGVTWSLAIEEQFYLVLPFIIRFAPLRRLPAMLGSLVVLAIAFRIILSAYFPESFVPPFVLMPCRADALMLGALCACLVRRPGFRERLANHTRQLYAAFGLLAAATAWTAVGSNLPGSGSMMVYGYSLLALLYVCLLLIAISEKRGPVSLITRNPVLRWFGLIAYGVYLMHQPINGFCRYLWLPQNGRADALAEQAVTVAAFVLTVMLASVSWLFFEKKIIAFGHTFKYRMPDDSPTPVKPPFPVVLNRTV
jgi:peptidoglycan/LPS O-acetylase OafA/YrhL